MKSRNLAAPILVLALLAGACGRATGSGGDGAIDHPTGANDLILRVATGGGFVPPTYALRQIPQFSLFGDGRLVTEGPQIEIYPGPALPAVQVQIITEDGIREILEAARDAGLLGPDADYAFPCVADAPTTTFTLNANGHEHVVSVYALGEGQGECAGSDAQARSKLAAFQARLSDLPSWLPSGSVGQQAPFEPAELRVYVMPYRSPDPGLVQPSLRWPLSGPLDTFGQPDANVPDVRCGVVGGQDHAIVLDRARDANELTPWRSDGRDYSLIFRPLLPDEHAC